MFMDGKCPPDRGGRGWGTGGKGKKKKKKKNFTHGVGNFPKQDFVGAMAIKFTKKARHLEFLPYAKCAKE